MKYIACLNVKNCGKVAEGGWDVTVVEQKNLEGRNAAWLRFTAAC